MKLLPFKKLVAPSLIAASLLGINSCCTDVYCLGTDDMNQIYFYGFKYQETDTIVIKRFDKNTNFKVLLDSTVAYSMASEPGLNFQIVLTGDENKLTIDYDYKVELPDSGKSFTISDFVSKEKRCNTGFLCNDTFNDLESYKLNGEVTRTSGVLEIHQ